MESHKRTLGILFVVLGAFQVLIMLLLNMFFSTIFTFAISEAEPKDARILELILGLVRYIPAFVIIFLGLPTIVAGIGLLKKQRWAMILALILACLHIFSFPVGTAIGIYTIWIYAEENRLLKANPAQG
jgi:hypothetical protein